MVTRVSKIYFFSSIQVMLPCSLSTIILYSALSSILNNGLLGTGTKVKSSPCNKKRQGSNKCFYLDSCIVFLQKQIMKKRLLFPNFSRLNKWKSLSSKYHLSSNFQRYSLSFLQSIQKALTTMSMQLAVETLALERLDWEEENTRI